MKQTTNTVNDKPKIEELFWRQKGSPDKIEYFFRNGSLTDNELFGVLKRTVK